MGVVEELLSKIRNNPKKWIPLLPLLGIEKLLEHRALTWANDRLDEGAGPLIEKSRDVLALVIAHPWWTVFVIVAAYSLVLIIIAHISVWFSKTDGRLRRDFNKLSGPQRIILKEICMRPGKSEFDLYTKLRELGYDEIPAKILNPLLTSRLVQRNHEGGIEPMADKEGYILNLLGGHPLG